MPEKKLKPGWTRVVFGDVVRQIKDKVDPANSDLKRYVAGEHMDTDDLKIRRVGLIGDGYLGPAFHMRFKPGQVLYGSRRTYLRKVALADFEGICANTTYVLETKDPKVLVPELLPFIMQTEAFHEHSIKQSKGSVNPYINFSDLTWYEFALPPLEEQREIAEAAIGFNMVANTHYGAAVLVRDTTKSLLQERFTGTHLGETTFDAGFGFYSCRLPLVALGNLLLATQYGISEAAVDGGRYPMLRMMNLSDGLARNDNLCFVDLSDEDFAHYRLCHGDVLFNRTNSHDLVGRTGVYRLQGDHVFASYLIRVNVDTNKLLPDYLCAYLNHPVGRRQVMRFATRGVSQSNVNVNNIRRMVIPLPPLKYQEEVISHVETMRATRLSLESRVEKAREAAMAIANRCLGVSS